MDIKYKFLHNKSNLLTGKLEIELKTIKLMTKLYCQNNPKTDHSKNSEALIKHAQQKLDRCVYGQDKPACKHCPIHCYKPKYTEQVRVIMRYSGRKMLFKHPVLAIKHLIKLTKKFPKKTPIGLSNFHQRKKNK